MRVHILYVSLKYLKIFGRSVYLEYICARKIETTYITTKKNTMSNKEKLFSEFKSPTKQEWLDKIQVDLKGADFNKKLVWRTNEGFNVQPFYRREDVLKLKTPDSFT